MGLIDFVDSVIGTDLSGNKARGMYEKGFERQSQATGQALETMKQYGQQAVDAYMKYMNQGLDETQAMNLAAQEAVQSGYGQARSDFTDYMGQAKDARSPYDQAAVSMMGALPQLQGALGLPGGSAYDVTASPMYQWQMGQMDEQMAAQLSAMGINNDKVAAYIRSKNVGQLGAEERQRQIGDLQNMVGMGMQSGQSLGAMDAATAQGLMGLGMGEGNMMGGLLSNAAANRGNMLATMGSDLANYNLGMGSNQANAMLGQGQSAMNMGISQAQQPNAMNQLLNTGLGLYGMGVFGNQRMSSPYSTPTANISQSPVPQAGSPNSPYDYNLQGSPRNNIPYRGNPYARDLLMRY